jgi:amidase
MAGELWQLDGVELGGLIRAGKVSAREAVESHLQRLDAVNPRLNAIVLPLHEQALAEADTADRARRAGQALGPLHGLPVTTKINSDQAGLPTDNGVAKFRDLIATEDSAQVGSLRRAGAIVIGRTNAPAFSMRGMTENALHGRTLNPWNSAITCGGSSGGAGASLAAGIGVIAQGNDIGGSIRWPAYCNGVVGLRPSLGRVAAFNGTATAPRRMSSQLMSVNGPLTRSVRDARLALAAMAVRDPRDQLWTPAPLVGEPPARPIRAALVTAVEGIDLHPAAVAAVRAAGACLAAAGYQVEEIAPPDLARVSELWHPIGLSDLNLSLRPFLKDAGDPGIERFIETWWGLYGGADLPTYLAALAERDTVLRVWNLFMETYPIIVMPSCPEVALPVNVDIEDAAGTVRMLDALRFQFVLPVLGLPGLAVPTAPVEGLPMGVQVVSRAATARICALTPARSSRRTSGHARRWTRASEAPYSIYRPPGGGSVLARSSKSGWRRASATYSSSVSSTRIRTRRRTVTGGLAFGPRRARSRRERRYGASTRRRMAAASSGGSSMAWTATRRAPSATVASPAARRFLAQSTSPWYAWTNRRPSNSSRPTGVVRGLPDRRPRTVRRMFGAPVGRPAAMSRRASGLTRRKNCTATRSRGSGRVRGGRSAAIEWLMCVAPSCVNPRGVPHRGPARRVPHVARSVLTCGTRASVSRGGRRGVLPGKWCAVGLKIRLEVLRAASLRTRPRTMVPLRGLGTGMTTPAVPIVTAVCAWLYCDRQRRWPARFSGRATRSCRGHIDRRGAALRSVHNSRPRIARWNWHGR